MELVGRGVEELCYGNHTTKQEKAIIEGKQIHAKIFFWPIILTQRRLTHGTEREAHSTTFIESVLLLKE